MHLDRRIVTPFALVILAVSLAVPAHAQPGKGEATGEPTAADQGLLSAELAAGRAAEQGHPAAHAALSRVHARIAHHVEVNGTRHSFGSFVDPATGKIVIETDAPAEVVASVAGSDAGAVDRRPFAISTAASRRDGWPPHYGGSGVVTSKGTCSTGFAVKDSGGTRFMLTAGHCANNGDSVLTELGSRNVGTVTGNGLPSRDMARIGGSLYGRSLYIGGIDSTTSLPVWGAADPAVNGTNYCHSGRSTGERCSHTVTSVNAQVCTVVGCHWPVATFTGGILPQGGDSGGPLYLKTSTAAYVRGMVIAVTNTTGYAEKWSRISSHYGVSIVI